VADSTKAKGRAPTLPRSRLRGNPGNGLSGLIGEDRLGADEVEKLRRSRLPPPADRFRIESLDHLWAAVGRFGLTAVADAAGVEPARLREALADLASAEIEGASSLLRRSLERWKRRWPWRVTALLFLLILAAGSLYWEARQPKARSRTGVTETPAERVVLTLPAMAESLVEARPGEEISLLLTAPSEGTVSPSLPGFLDHVLLLEIRTEPSPALVVAVPTELLRKLAPLPSGLRATVVRPLAAEDEQATDPEPESGSDRGS